MSMPDHAGNDEQDFSKHHIFKIIVIGNSNVGKTCLTVRFCRGRFMGNVETTIGFDCLSKTVAFGDHSVKLQIWDTAGQERFRQSLVRQYYRNAHAVLFVYDVTDTSSFEALPRLFDECNSQVKSHIFRVLVGNKNDMIEKKCVQTKRARKFAEFHDMPFHETSAKDDREEAHIEKIFRTLAEKLFERVTHVSTSKWKTDDLTFGLSYPKPESIDSSSESGAGSSCLC